ncbi:MAG: hypothetical protein ABI947_16585 [Chloroflexota bacterium]
MATAIRVQPSMPNLLRIALRADGIVEIVFGIIGIVDAELIDTFSKANLGFSLGRPAVVISSAILPLYGVALLWTAARPTISTQQAMIPITINAVSGVITIALLVMGWSKFTNEGRWAIFVLASVGDFAILQAYGLYRQRKLN